MTTTTHDEPPNILIGPPTPGRNGDWITGPNGQRIYPFDLRLEDFDIRWIARGLSGERRWRGFTRDPYYVSQHAVLVSLTCDPEDSLWGLCHDNFEAIGGDVPSPMKRSPLYAGYREIEATFTRWTCNCLGLPHIMPASVKRADKLLGATEARDLFDVLDPEWAERLKSAEMLEDKIEAWGSWKAEWMFLERFHELTGGKH